MLAGTDYILKCYRLKTMPPQHTYITVGFFHNYSYTQLREMTSAFNTRHSPFHQCPATSFATE